jgi:hypothetical protein
LQSYPSIDNIITNQPIYAFDKLDGSNMRAEWSPKSGFYKFGSRRRLISVDEKPLGESIEIFMDTHADALDKIFRKERIQKATAFFEFYGKNSFAGFHEDEPHAVSLFDVHVFKKGFIPPKEFIKLFEDTVKTPELLYIGKANREFIESVRSSTLSNMTLEGVVCKGGVDKHGNVSRFKIKSEAWLNLLKNKFKNDEKMFELLK